MTVPAVDCGPAAVAFAGARGKLLSVFVEDWGATYGSPYLVPGDDQSATTAELVEDGQGLRFHPGTAYEHAGIAFVDGVRRGEASLYFQDPASGAMARGVAGAHACGAVVGDGVHRMEFREIRTGRLAIWGSGIVARLPDVAGGWSWRAASIADPSPDAPLQELQTRMRQAEGELAEELAGSGLLVIVDGPLNFVRSRDLPVVGYVKTHYRMLLPLALHRRVPGLAAGERTSLFRLGADRYSCYLRLTALGESSGPWAGIVRLEVPQSAGLAQAIGVADRVAGTVPRFAGVAHLDPRAPQNLQPVGGLETHLRHRLGDLGLAARAVREAVAKLSAAPVGGTS
jgi:hypothetical protein